MRFSSSPEAEPYIQDFTAHNLGGGKLEYEFQNIDDSVLTFRGLKWITGITSEKDFSQSSLYSTNFESQLCLYIPMGNRSTVALRAGGATRVGDFEFYQANVLGGQNVKRDNGNLRGSLRGRYAGRTSAYINTDLRLKLFSFHTYLVPIDFGVLGFYDQGRVWVDHEKSNTWHSGYGGGLWIDPLGLAIINFSYAISKEEKLFTVNLGFLF